MKSTRKTLIDDLTTVGHELSEEHLAVASGGARPGTKIRTDVTPRGDVEYDYYA